MSKLPVPLGHLVMVRVPELDRVSSGGIILKDDSRREQNGEQKGFVHSIGPDAYKSLGDGSRWVEVGDEVYFKRYAGIEFRDDWDEDEQIKQDQSVYGKARVITKKIKHSVLYRLMNDDDIYAVFPEGKE